MDKTIRFIDRAEVDYADGQGLLVYEEGSVHTLRSDKADRWIRRGKAVEATADDLFGSKSDGDKVGGAADVDGQDSSGAGGGREPQAAVAAPVAQRGGKHQGHRR